MGLEVPDNVPRPGRPGSERRGANRYLRSRRVCCACGAPTVHGGPIGPKIPHLGYGAHGAEVRSKRSGHATNARTIARLMSSYGFGGEWPLSMTGMAYRPAFPDRHDARW